MAVLKEFSCIEHGPFEGSHPICPASGCDSSAVSQEFRTAPTIGSGFVKRFDAGIRKSSDMMGGKNFRTARAGEAAYGGDAAKETGLGVLWGDESRKVLGRSFAELTQVAAKPLEVRKRDGSGTIRMDRNNGMREAVAATGLTGRRLPRAADVTAEPSAKAQAQALAS